MMYYLITPFPDRHKQEIDLIKGVCDLEGLQIFDYSKRTDLVKKHLVKEYYKGGNPAIVISKDFIDVETNFPPTVVYGFWMFIDYLLKNGCIRC